MAHGPIATRYAQALFDTAKAQGEVEETLKQLMSLGTLFDEHPDLRQFMSDPGVTPEEKTGLLQRMLQGAWSPLVEAFLHMAVSLRRAELLRGMVDAFQAAVDVEQRRLRVVVRSAHELPGTVLTTLQRRLEALEDKTVELTAELDPELIGGLQVHMGSRVIDHSVRRQLDDMRQHLKTIRVH